MDTIEGAHAGFEALLGSGAALAFAIALLASGLSSSSVGTYAGQIVMQGFIQRRIPLFLRRGLTMAPSLIVLAMGVDLTDVLVISQVVLSFGIPFALVPMIMLTRRDDVMGALVNKRGTTIVACVVAAVIICLNVFLLYDTFIGSDVHAPRSRTTRRRSTRSQERAEDGVVTTTALAERLEVTPGSVSGDAAQARRRRPRRPRALPRRAPHRRRAAASRSRSSATTG